jgi:hypothetical protein
VRTVAQRLRGDLLRLRRSQKARLAHQAQHGQLAVLGSLRVSQRIVAGGVLDQPGQQRALGAAQLVGGLGEEDLGGGLEAEGKVAVVGLVQVKRQQFILAVGALQLPGQPCLAQLACVGLGVALFGGQEQGARQLLRQRAAAAHHVAAAEVLPDRAPDGQWVDAKVGKEAAILGGDGGLDAGRGDVIQRQVDLLAGVGVDHLVEQPAVAVEDLRGGARRAQGSRGHRRQVGKEPSVESAGGEDGNRDDGQQRQPEPAPPGRKPQMHHRLATEQGDQLFRDVRIERG